MGKALTFVVTIEVDDASNKEKNSELVRNLLTGSHVAGSLHKGGQFKILDLHSQLPKDWDGPPTNHFFESNETKIKKQKELEESNKRKQKQDLEKLGDW